MMLGHVAGRAATSAKHSGPAGPRAYADAAQRIAEAYHRAFFDRGLRDLPPTKPVPAER